LGARNDGGIMSDLQRAIEIAVTAHRGQKRKNGMPYVLHPLRLMMAVESVDEKIAAVLHDVVEDTSVTLAELRREGFSPSILQALECLTHNDDVPYQDYIENLKKNALATAVKLADLQDNSQFLMLPKLSKRDCQRMKKYHRAWTTLTDAQPGPTVSKRS